ncbi:Nucleoporin, Nup133/Nup155-like protein [Blyttiomyces helicus]|uniref:Nucleoporin, Nup133/Nup155-like protein n=1 Tax=Blyttiomyces helicus TaxID=388810 RepID=A0A4P9W4L9_9FUNG|nr:Nucleoporin, Nup133/Nup155-like protein [Blyttiomyces helicus]|eukprot:RKO86852.1 Nucleoporin, Nup133/Nup155-like protein [Blyttiomyces helicus]
MDIGGLLGVPLQPSGITYSGKHDGLSFYLARLLKRIWKFKVIKKRYERLFRENCDKTFGISASHLPYSSSTRIIDSTFTIDELTRIQSKLLELERVLKGFSKFTAEPTPELRPTNARTDDADAWRAEQQSLYNLHQLLLTSIECISLVTMLIDQNIASIIMRVDQPKRKEIEELTFEGMVTTLRGREVVKVLMTALVDRHITDHGNVQSVLDMFEQRCPNLCSKTQLLEFQGNEQLQMARTIRSKESRVVALRESLLLYMKVIQDMPIERLNVICLKYRELEFYTGIIDIALAWTAAYDTGATGVGFKTGELYASSGYRAEDDIKLAAGHQIILSLVEYVLALRSPGEGQRLSPDESESLRAEIVNRALKSQSVLFHETLYDWLIAHDYTEALLEVLTWKLQKPLFGRPVVDFLRHPYLHEFLDRGKNDFVKGTLLARYLAKQGSISRAAIIYRHLAETDGLQLNARVQLLNTAASWARQAVDLGEKSDALQDILDEKEGKLLTPSDFLVMKVAGLQLEIYQRTLAHPDLQTAQGALNNQLFDAQKLFYEFAWKYDMHEISLALLHLTNARDSKKVVTDTWAALIATKLAENCGSPFEPLRAKIKELALRYGREEGVFPLGLMFPYTRFSDLEARAPLLRCVGKESFVRERMGREHLPRGEGFA